MAAAQEAAAQHAEEEERRNRSGGVLGFGNLAYFGASSRSAFLAANYGYGSGSPCNSAGGAMGSKRPVSAAAAAAGTLPTSLFILTEKNIIRRYTRFIIEWPYPFIYLFLNYIFNYYSCRMQISLTISALRLNMPFC